MRIALAQLNPIVGDIVGNTALVLNAIDQARQDGADVLVTSELALIGYPPRDLLIREGVVEACEQAVRQIARHAGNIYVIVCHPRIGPAGSRPFRNSASVCRNGEIVAVCDKQLLPGYDVFDEDRYFEPGGRSLCVPIHDRRVGILICEDLWRAKDVSAKRQYAVEPVAECAAQGCDLIISLNASPFVVGKWQRHIRQLSEIATDYRLQLVAVNQVGANDDLVFDGRSVVVERNGEISALLPGFQSAVETIELSAAGQESAPAAAASQRQRLLDQWNQPEREVFHALTLGIRDYVGKTGHQDVLVGLSGGVDSAVVAALCAAAVGPRHVHGVMMPSIYSSSGSVSDAVDLARRLGLASCDEISIKAIHQAMRQTLEPALGSQCAGITDENLQSRLRAVILMAISNARGMLLISTSNKSEVATGYSTLYGDMCGAVAAIGDLLKTRLYDLVRWMNANHQECGFARPPIPENSIQKPPSAELRPNQTDQDTLPPYEILDQIIERRIEREESEETIIAETGFEPGLVRKTLLMIDRAQYKRDQAPVILKLTPRAFGRGRPMPIVMKASDLRSAAGGLRSGSSSDAQSISEAPPLSLVHRDA